MTKFQSSSSAALAALALAIGSTAALAPLPAAAASGEEACKEAIAVRTGGEVGTPDVSVGADGMVTVQTMVAGQTYICTADATGKVLEVMQQKRDG
ncbi:MAG: hypothetical protein JNK88_05755 [Mangrovicoccus sp.]|nr:hypothetical protein [Mangrovicoccus sp.]